MIKDLLKIYNDCEDAKIASFEAGIRAEDLTKWNKEADRLELAAYQKFKDIMREVNLNGLPEVREQDKGLGQPGFCRDDVPQAKVS